MAVQAPTWHDMRSGFFGGSDKYWHDEQRRLCAVSNVDQLLRMSTTGRLHFWRARMSLRLQILLRKRRHQNIQAEMR
jgi:hypothetical protein